MDWNCLGHAMWLVEAAGLRLLCDPLLGPEHHGGVFETVPRRTVVADALRPDFILVSHRHPDHFDVRSLHRLARLDPEAVVVTPDALVAWAARALGFTTVHQVPAGQHVVLDGLAMVTTPSLAPDEWGVMIAADGAVAWNQVDSVLRNPEHVREVAERALGGLGQDHLDLAVVRWQPMLEIAAVLGHRTHFPYATYGDLLLQAAATHAAAVVPGANGAAHVAAHRWMDRFVFPVPEERFVRDLAAACPTTTPLPLQVGGRYRVTSGAVQLEPAGAAHLVEPEPGDEPRRYRPLAIPELRDPNPGGHDEGLMRAQVRDWIHQTLAGALAEAWPGMACSRPLRCVLEVIYERAHDVFTLQVGPEGTSVHEGFDDDWDLLNAIAGSMCWSVLQGHLNWGDVLLSGCLRGLTRAYTVDPQGLHRAEVGEIFLYYGLSYDEAVERAVRREVEMLLSGL